MYDECRHKLSLYAWKEINDVFNWLPAAAPIERRIFCVHGGSSPELESLENIAKVNRPLEDLNHGLIVDMIWSDPEANQSGWMENERGISYTYGSECVNNFLHDNKLDLIVRSHQLVPMGYEFLFNKHLVTLFSVPNFHGHGNCGAILAVERDLTCSFEIIKPAHSQKMQFRDKARELMKP